MAIGDVVLYQGRRYVLLGVDPMSVTDRRAELRDSESGERLRVPVDELEVDEEPRDLRGD